MDSKTVSHCLSLSALVGSYETRAVSGWIILNFTYLTPELGHLQYINAT